MKKSQKWVFHLFAVIILSNFCLAQSSRRDAKVQPERVMDAIGLKPGMVIGEAGAGRGYLTFKLIGRIGESGKIYANDIDKGVLKSIRNRCERERIHNITTVLGEVADPRFPVNDLDMIIMLHAFHDFEKKVEWLKNAKKYMKPRATLVIIDSHDPHTGLDKSKVSAMGEEAGLELVQYETFLQDDFIYVFKIGERKSSFVEPGEQRRNDWHPPERIMDTLGLKPGMVIVEYDPAKTGDRTGHSSTPKETFIQQANAAGYEVYRIETFLEWDNMYFCRRKD